MEIPLIVTPTGKGIRIIDSWGSGLFGAPRGNKAHLGLDVRCEPGKPFVAPFTPIRVSRSNPYLNSLDYGGLAFWSEWFILQLWYIEPFDWVLQPDTRIKRGWEIGICQDIRKKISRSSKKPYGDRMIPHLHMQIKIRNGYLLPASTDKRYIDPEVLM